MPLWPRVSEHLEILKAKAASEQERREVEVLERLAKEVDAVSPEELKLDKLYAFMRSVHAFRQYWGSKPGAEAAYKGIARAVEEYLDEELEQGARKRGVSVQA